MNDKPNTLKLPEKLHKEMQNFFRRTSLPKIQRQRVLEKIEARAEIDTPTGNKE